MSELWGNTHPRDYSPPSYRHDGRRNHLRRSSQPPMSDADLAAYEYWMVVIDPGGGCDAAMKREARRAILSFSDRLMDMVAWQATQIEHFRAATTADQSAMAHALQRNELLENALAHIKRTLAYDLEGEPGATPPTE